MIVRKDDRCGVVRERLSQHFARVHAGAVDGAAEELFEGDQAVSFIEIKTAENLIRPITQLRIEKASGLER